ncbi:alpha-L-rhamnosidase rgxB protein [Rutstroemia sp. NJR-2017a WRK4]|nr:alpha-L-rhamnosidase rgxB protein [Rutstroemia sp. NJR-2017a WRK4]
MFWPCALQWLSVFFFIANTSANTVHVPRATCTITPSLNGSDDAPAILSAFKTCGKGGTVVFQNHTYTINSIMNTTGLSNCNIEIHGTLLVPEIPWSTNITYWLNHSMPLGYQNQSTVWYLGGDNIKVDGFGYGTLDGNGQAWYDFVKGISNYPNRPQALAIYKTTNSVFQGLRFVQSQMWTMTVLRSDGVLLQNIYVNSTSSSGNPARNTDGADTLYSNNIHFDKWTVVNGDDSISLKANSTNILITNSTFYNGLGVAIGSIGQYKGVWETIENVTASHITFYKTLHGGYVKTWTGEQVGYPPNGGGGGLGYAKNITFENFSFHSLRGPPFSITQCTTFSGTSGNCSSSAFSVSDLYMVNITGSMTNPIASYSCSAVAPCKNITMENLTLKANNGTAATGYKCTNVEGTVGFTCS